MQPRKAWRFIRLQWRVVEQLVLTASHVLQYTTPLDIIILVNILLATFQHYSSQIFDKSLFILFKSQITVHDFVFQNLSSWCSRLPFFLSTA